MFIGRQPKLVSLDPFIHNERVDAEGDFEDRIDPIIVRRTIQIEISLATREELSIEEETCESSDESKTTVTDSPACFIGTGRVTRNRGVLDDSIGIDIEKPYEVSENSPLVEISIREMEDVENDARFHEKKFFMLNNWNVLDARISRAVRRSGKRSDRVRLMERRIHRLVVNRKKHNIHHLVAH